MGLVSRFFGLQSVCPECRMPGARDTMKGVLCANPDCSLFNRDYAIETGQLTNGKGQQSSPDESVEVEDLYPRTKDKGGE